MSLLASKKKEYTRALTSAAVVVADSVLLNKNSYFIFLSFSYRAKAIKWLFESAIGRLVQLNASLERASLDFGTNLLAHIAAMSSIRLRMVSIESETCWIFFFAPDLIIISTIFFAHNLISFSAIVCRSLHFVFDMPPDVVVVVYYQTPFEGWGRAEDHGAP